MLAIFVQPNTNLSTMKRQKQGKLDRVVKIHDKPLAELLPFGAKVEIAKSFEVEPSYITQILNGDRKNSKILLELVDRAIKHQMGHAPVEESLQEKLAKLSKIVAKPEPIAAN